MTHAAALRTTLITSFTLLLSNSIVCAQTDVPAVVENESAPIYESNPIATPSNAKPAQKQVDKLDAAKKASSGIAEARPGERVTNPAHSILNLDTKLGGVEIKGTKISDFGYKGPGDMRTHLWNAHAKELIKNGITESKLMAMTVPEVQEWHNRFHDVGEDGHHEDEQSHLGTIEQQPMTSSTTTYVDPVSGTTVYRFSDYNHSEYSQPFYGQPEIIYEQGTIIEGPATYGFQGGIQSWSIDQ